MKTCSFWDLTPESKIKWSFSVLKLLLIPPLGRFRLRKCDFCRNVDDNFVFDLWFDKPKTPKLILRYSKDLMGSANIFRVAVISINSKVNSRFYKNLCEVRQSKKFGVTLDKVMWDTFLHELAHIDDNVDKYDSHGIMFVLRYIRVYFIVWVYYLRKVVIRLACKGKKKGGKK